MTTIRVLIEGDLRLAVGTAEDEVTICDLTGTGAQDTAIASLAVERCIRAGAGIAIDT